MACYHKLLNTLHNEVKFILLGFRISQLYKVLNERNKIILLPVSAVVIYF
jgi:hypothetical protein